MSKPGPPSSFPRPPQIREMSLQNKDAAGIRHSGGTESRGRRKRVAWNVLPGQVTRPDAATLPLSPTGRVGSSPRSDWWTAGQLSRQSVVQECRDTCTGEFGATGRDKQREVTSGEVRCEQPPAVFTGKTVLPDGFAHSLCVGTRDRMDFSGHERRREKRGRDPFLRR